MDSTRSTCVLVCQQPRCFSRHLRRKRTETSRNLRGVVLGVVDAAVSKLRSRERRDDQGRLLGILWWLNMPRVSNKNHREDEEHPISGKAESVRLSHCDLWLLPLILWDSVTVSYAATWIIKQGTMFLSPPSTPSYSGMNANV